MAAMNDVKNDLRYTGRRRWLKAAVKESRLR
jgi:hypothetical protein